MQTAFATVNITVTRNENAPVFTQNIYEVTIAETSVLGSNVVQLTASDQDTLVNLFFFLCCYLKYINLSMTPHASVFF